ncbi:IS110 family RNA-guided transposase [Thalassobacter stenotrophicus]|uniref:IS110 family transposase n=1 Tax=Thalassobacter stenotrophicus TaxID=266809 RepID=UPI000D5ED77C|nr:IS110 family transposase [Thalassobacter stenotrophicus]PVZ48643.1 IS110 family transposase [Thalassobacter stenotrophicus]
MDAAIIGVDLAKRVIQIHGAEKSGETVYRKKLTRDQFYRFMTEIPSCIVAFEACGSANHWARQMELIGHEARLIPPQYVRPFVKRQKNDAADAEAIVTAARQPGMRFVSAKTEEQQSKIVVFRGRERLVHQRTELVNALRSTLYEFGYVFPIGRASMPQIAALIDDPSADLPSIVRLECQDLLQQIAEKTARIDEKSKKLQEAGAQGEKGKLLQSMPGVGPMTALAVQAFAPEMTQFKSGRDFAAWLGLVPRQFSSGGKARLGRVSKAGQADIRRLLIIGAMSRIVGRARNNIAPDTWLGRMLARKPKMLVAVALANKMARQIWAMLTREERYRDPVMSA